MKNYALRISCVLALFSSIACSDSDPITPILITDDSSAVTLTSEVVGQTVNFTANNSWSIEIVLLSDQTEQWLSVSPMGGMAGEQTITITPSQNNLSTTRSAQVIIEARGTQKIITVTQDPNYLNAEYIDFVDENFKAALLDGYNYTNPTTSAVTTITVDTNGDGNISYEEALAVRVMMLDYDSIAQMPEIKYFTQLDTLSVSNNQLTELDLTDLISLEYLDCEDNQLTELNIEANAMLTDLNISHNTISAINLSQNTMLTNLDASNCSLTELDLSSNTALSQVDLSENSLTELSFENSPSVEMISCEDNLISSLNIYGCTELTDLSASSNMLTLIDLSTNTMLSSAHLSDNELTEINIDQNSALRTLEINNNSLTTLGISANSNLMFIECTENHIATLDISDNTLLLSASVSGQTDSTSGASQDITVTLTQTQSTNGVVSDSDSTDVILSVE